jgi:hypothetical protein
MNESKINNFIFFVGGTGQQVAYNYFNLIRLLDKDPYNFLFIDGDNMEYDENGEKTITGYLIEEFKEEFEVINEKYKNPGASLGDSSVSFESFFSHDYKIPIFTEKEQRETAVAEGFFGQPMVGAAVFDEKKDKFNFPMVTGSSKIAFVSSCFGGTGAGVTPVLIDKYSQDVFSFYIIHGKFFSINKANVEEIQERNNDSAFYYYFDKFNKKLNRIIVFDKPKDVEGTLVIEGEDIKDKRQSVRYFSYDLLSALTLIGFLDIDLDKANLNDSVPLEFKTLFFKSHPIKLNTFLTKKINAEDEIFNGKNTASVNNFLNQLEITRETALYYAVLFYNFDGKWIGSWNDHTPKEFDKIISNLNEAEYNNLKDNLKTKYERIKRSFERLGYFKKIAENNKLIEIPDIYLPDLSQEQDINSEINSISIGEKSFSVKEVLKYSLKKERIKKYESFIKGKGELFNFAKDIFTSIRESIEECHEKGGKKCF